MNVDDKRKNERNTHTKERDSLLSVAHVWCWRRPFWKWTWFEDQVTCLTYDKCSSVENAIIKPRFDLYKLMINFSILERLQLLSHYNPWIVISGTSFYTLIVSLYSSLVFIFSSFPHIQLISSVALPIICTYNFNSRRNLSAVYIDRLLHFKCFL